MYSNRVDSSQGEHVEEKTSIQQMDLELKRHSELSRSKTIDNAYKWFSKSLLTPLPDSENPWRDRFVSGAAHLATMQILALTTPQSIPKYLAEMGIRSLSMGTPPLESAIAKVTKDEEIQGWWNHQVSLTGEGPTFQGAASLAKLGITLASVPDKLLHLIHDTLRSRLSAICDKLGITDQNVALVATRTLELLARNSPELLDEQAWSMAFSYKNKKISNISTSDHAKETIQYCENIQKKWNEKFATIQKIIPQKSAFQPKPEIEKLTASLREEASSLLEKINRHVKSNNTLITVEKSSSAERHVKIEQEIQKASFEEYIFMRSTFSDLCEGVSCAISIMGESQTAQKVATFGHATVKLLDSVYMLANNTAVTNPVFSSSSMLSPIAPYVGILSAGASFISLLKHKKKKDHSLEILVQEMQRISQILLDQISILHKDMVNRFNQLENQVSHLQKHMMHGFLFLEKELLDAKIPVLYSLSRIESEIKTLQVINSKVDSLLLKEFTKTCAEIESYPSRYGDLDAMPEKEFLEHAKTLENTLLGIAPSSIYINGALITDTSASTINRLLTSAKPEAILGFLAILMQQEFKCTLAKNIIPSELPNLMIYILGTEHYLTLRENFIYKEYDPKSIQINKIIEAGEIIIEFINSIQTNKNLLEQLIARYKNASEKVSTLCSKAMQKKSNEIAELVYNTGLSLRKISIQDARCPLDTIYKKFGIEYTKELIKSSEYNLSELNRIWRINLEWPKNKTLDHLPGRKYSGPQISLHPFVHPQEEQKKVLINYSLPLLKLENQVVGNSIAEALFAERLGLGYIDYEYYIQDKRRDLPYNSGLDGHGPVEFNMSVSFKKNVDKSTVYLMDIKYQGITNSHFVGAKQQIYQSLTAQERCTTLLHSAWTSRHSVRWFDRFNRYYMTYTTNLNALGSLVDEALVTRRKEAIATLYQTSALGAEYQQVLEEMDLSYHLIKAFSSLAGFDQKEIESLNLLNRDKIISHQQAYLSGSFGETSPWVPVSGDPSSLLNRFNKPLPSNPFITMIKVQLARLGLLVVQSIDEHARQDKFVHMQQELKGNNKSEIDETLIKKLDLAQQTIDKQNEQIAKMAEAIAEMQQQQQMMFQLMQQRQDPKKTILSTKEEKEVPLDLSFQIPTDAAKLIATHSGIITSPKEKTVNSREPGSNINDIENKLSNLSQ